MRKNYRKAIHKGGRRFDNTKWILDSIKLEFDFGSPKSANEMLKKFVIEKLQMKTAILTENFEQNFLWLKDTVSGAESMRPSLSDSCFVFKQSIFLEKSFHCSEISFKNVKFQRIAKISQCFAIPKPVLSYICKNADYRTLQKLQYTSKEMYFWTKKTLCFKLSVTDLNFTQAQDEALFISGSNPGIGNIKNIFVFNTLFIDYNEAETLSKLIVSKFCKCSAKFIILRSQILTLNEYYFLTNSKAVKVMDLFNTTVNRDDDGSMASLEDLMENLPNASNLRSIWFKKSTRNRPNGFRALPPANFLSSLFFLWSR